MPHIEYDARVNLSKYVLFSLIEDLNLLLGSNAIVTYDVRLGYKTDEMYEDSSSEWKLEVKSRESRSIQCQPTYHYGMENKVSFMLAGGP